MSPEQQRICIAEACGSKWFKWGDAPQESNRFISPPGKGPTYVYGGSMIPCERPSHGTPQNLSDLPDYLSDLNAMHEAEKALTSTEQQNRYQMNIAEICYADESRANNQVVFNQLTATAPQRAEAFLKAKGLWQNEPIPA